MGVWDLRMEGWEHMGWDRIRLRHTRTLGRRTRMPDHLIREDLRILGEDRLIQVLGLNIRAHLILALGHTRTSGLRIRTCLLTRICLYTEGWG